MEELNEKKKYIICNQGRRREKARREEEEGSQIYPLMRQGFEKMYYHEHFFLWGEVTRVVG